MYNIDYFCCQILFKLTQQGGKFMPLDKKQERNFLKQAKQQSKLLDELDNFKKKLKPMLKSAVKDGALSKKDYNIIMGRKFECSEDIIKMVISPVDFRKFVPKLKNRIDKRKKFLNDCKRKLDSLPKDMELNLPTIEQLKNSVESHSIFDKSNFLRDLTVEFNKNFEKANLINNLLNDFLEKNKDLIEFSDNATIDSICKNFNSIATHSSEKYWYKKWLLESSVTNIMNTVKNNPQQANNYITQMEISLDKLNELYKWLGNNMPQMVQIKIATDLEQYEKKNKKLLKSHNIKVFDTKRILNRMEKQSPYVDNSYAIFESHISCIIKKLNTSPFDFTYNATIKPLIKNFKKYLKNLTQGIFKIEKEFIDNDSKELGDDDKKLWKPDWCY